MYKMTCIAFAFIILYYGVNKYLLYVVNLTLMVSKINNTKFNFKREATKKNFNINYNWNNVKQVIFY